MDRSKAVRCLRENLGISLFEAHDLVGDLTLTDKIAIEVLNGLLSNSTVDIVKGKALVKNAYEYAEVMLAEKIKRSTSDEE